ncbi:accessory gene regulator B family protein [Paenibacillus oleatilyticus]|uniref:accessory gene regulator B family protein n=1 Tax=Paenibacillus oleatilyticus TaxID=2594886 RepID=UPI001C1F8E5D|nr:accessory gene regulator B family protein [Paenibacillus oleatilyticus]MBU7316063.1 accessory gene regulator B family protein [Paenibacillus oleatilyticus]
MLNKIACYTSSFLSNTIQDSKYTAEELEYGIKILLNNISILVISFLISYLFNDTYSWFIVTANFVLLRFFSGGVHFKSSEACIIVSTFLIVFIQIIVPYITSYIPVLNAISLLIVLLLAPSGIHNQINLKAKNIEIYFKFISAALVLINFLIIESNLVSVTYFIQSLLLILNLRKQRG